MFLFVCVVLCFCRVLFCLMGCVLFYVCVRSVFGVLFFVCGFVSRFLCVCVVELFPSSLLCV